MVPLYRNHIFAQMKPATLPRVDLGFAEVKKWLKAAYEGDAR
jgi:hypothetical protein